jgi:hypothetical protein
VTLTYPIANQIRDNPLLRSVEEKKQPGEAAEGAPKGKEGYGHQRSGHISATKSNITKGLIERSSRREIFTARLFDSFLELCNGDVEFVDCCVMFLDKAFE